MIHFNSVSLSFEPRPPVDHLVRRGNRLQSGVAGEKPANGSDWSGSVDHDEV